MGGSLGFGRVMCHLVITLSFSWPPSESIPRSYYNLPLSKPRPRAHDVVNQGFPRPKSKSNMEFKHAPCLGHFSIRGRGGGKFG